MSLRTNNKRRGLMAEINVVPYIDVMLVLVVLVMVMVVMMPMLMVMLILIVVMMVLMFVVVLVMFIVIVMMVMLMLVLGLFDLVLAAHLFQKLLAERHLFDGGEDGLAVQLVPRSRQNGGVGVLLAQHGDSGGDLFLAGGLGAAEQDAACVADLVIVELAEVLHIHLDLVHIGHGDKAVQLHIQMLSHTLHSAGNIAQLAHTGGLNDDAVGVVLLHHLLQSGTEIAHQRAADAACVQLVDLDAGLLQEAAVDADLTELVLDQNDLLAGKGLLDEFFDQSGLAGAQEAGKNINFGHSLNASFFVSRQSRRALARKILHLYYSKPVNGKRAFFKKKL